MKLEHCLNIEDLRRAAKRRAHHMAFEYLDGGADDQVTLGWNSSAFADWELPFHVLRGCEKVDTSTTLLGEHIEVPFFASPAAGQRLFHDEGELASARAAHSVGTVFSLSTLSTHSIEQVAKEAPGPRWFQLYVWNDRELVHDMLQRAAENGYTALILTVDLSVHGNREREPRSGFTVPPKLSLKSAWGAVCAPKWTMDYLTRPAIKYANLDKAAAAMSLRDFVLQQFDRSFSWKDAEWLLQEWNGPVVIKGIVRPDDARQAADLGFAGIMVSNHGGRQLDFSPAPVHVLEPIVDRVAGDAEVILDGGVRRGTDIIKALALGANAVSFARPYLYGLAAAGETGARHAMNLMKTELERDMTLLGTPSIQDISRDMVNKRKN